MKQLTLLTAILISSFTLSASLSVAASGKGDQGIKFQGSYPIHIVATEGMLADLAKNIGGAKLDVRTLVTGDPHQFQPSAEDLQQLERAQLILTNGLELEPRLSGILEKYNKKTLAIGERLDRELLLRSEQLERHFDPHIWLDVTLWQKAAQLVDDTLSSYDPANKTLYSSRTATYLDQLTALHRYATAIIQSIPRDNRVLISAHDAFHYFGRMYDLEVRGVAGTSTEIDSIPKNMNALADFIVGKKVSVVFEESTVPKKEIETLIKAVEAKGTEIKVGGVLFSDALGPEGSRSGTYIGMIEADVNTIARALGGNVPERGFVTLEDIRKQSPK